MSYECKHFSIEELTPPGHQNWSLVRDELLETLDEIHDLLTEKYSKFDRIIMRINTWNNGGKFKYRGWRPKDCSTGSQMSQHKYGNAADFDAFTVKDGVEARIDPDVVRGLLSRWKLTDGKLKHLGGMEDGVNWVHVDCRNYGDGLCVFTS